MTTTSSVTTPPVAAQTETTPTAVSASATTAKVKTKEVDATFSRVGGINKVTVDVRPKPEFKGFGLGGEAQFSDDGKRVGARFYGSYSHPLARRVALVTQTSVATGLDATDPTLALMTVEARGGATVRFAANKNHQLSLGFEMQGRYTSAHRDAAPAAAAVDSRIAATDEAASVRNDAIKKLGLAFGQTLIDSFRKNGVDTTTAQSRFNDLSTWLSFLPTDRDWAISAGENSANAYEYICTEGYVRIPAAASAEIDAAYKAFCAQVEALPEPTPQAATAGATATLPALTISAVSASASFTVSYTGRFPLSRADKVAVVAGASASLQGPVVQKPGAHVALPLDAPVNCLSVKEVAQAGMSAKVDSVDVSAMLGVQRASRMGDANPRAQAFALIGVSVPLP